MEIKLGEIAEKIGGKLQGKSEKIIMKAASFINAGENDITFLADKKILKKIDSVKKIGAVILTQHLFNAASFDNTIIVDNPKFAFAQTISILHPQPKLNPQISPDVRIEKSSIIGKNVTIGSFSYIGKKATIEDRVTIYPNVFVGDNVTIGADTVIYPNVVIYAETIIGKRVIIHAGSVIGSDGFGYVHANGKHNKIPHIGIVQIDDEVEIGASNTIDRGALDKTWIQKGVKTDNLVHIAHNVEIGENSLIIAQVGIAGSAKIGKNVIIAGQAGVGGHLNIEDQVIIGPQCGVSKSITKGETVSSTLVQMPHKTWLRVQHIIPKLPEIKRKIDKIEKKLENENESFN